MLTFPTLGRLIEPVPTEQFFAHHWERQPLRVHTQNSDRFTSLVSRESLDALLAEGDLHHPSVSAIDHRHRIRSEAYTYPSGLIDSVRLFKLWAEGASMVFSQLESKNLSLAMLCRALEQEFSIRFQANIYLTPGNAQGFRPHYDSHDVIILQVEGRKHWLLYDTPVELPLRTDEFDPERVGCGEVTDEFDLNPGDVLYLPRGLMHDARTLEGEHSLHITLGVLNTPWSELFTDVLEKIVRQDPRFRQSLPPGFAREGFDNTSTHVHFDALVRSFTEKASLLPFLDHFADDLVDTRHPRLPGQFAQLERASQLTADDRVGVREGLVYRLSTTDEHVVVSAYGAGVALPLRAETTVRHILSHGDTVVRELPGNLDDSGKLVVVRRMVREGLARVIDSGR